ncbi:MAG: hypothetical protein EZS28_038899 [Streblomastix strix]|uniref:Tyr recombinase domain-containing protein n=1 Tax=Streblomastix strix TaxID=222440 RepID=A0A5J4U769_9EUKA|nr:MAG: hypothetical protein EZS28_038899 [Streblomastix strix]
MCTTRDNGNSTDKYFEGEQLYRKLAAQSGLGQLTIDELIKSTSFETWRKRRTGLTYLADYIKSQGKKQEDFLDTRLDAVFVNALTWLKSNGGVKYKSKIKSLRTHGCVVLSQFSQMLDISHSPLILAFSKGLGIQTIPKAKYPTTWNFQILFDYIQTTKFSKIEEKQQVAMALVVAFSAARMTELVLMKISEMQIMRNQISVKTQTSKGKNRIDHTITFKQRTGLICPVRALRVWLDERRSLKLQSDSLWWNFSKNNTPTADNCSHMLTEIIRKAGVPEIYSGPTICHAMMTKLRACGATQAEVNAYTRHQLTSNVVDAYYFRPHIQER